MSVGYLTSSYQIRLVSHGLWLLLSISTISLLPVLTFTRKLIVKPVEHCSTKPAHTSCHTDYDLDQWCDLASDGDHYQCRDGIYYKRRTMNRTCQQELSIRHNGLTRTRITTLGKHSRTCRENLDCHAHRIRDPNSFLLCPWRILIPQK